MIKLLISKYPGLDLCQAETSIYMKKSNSLVTGCGRLVIFTIITISAPAEPGNCKTKYKHNIFRGDQSIQSFCEMQFNVLSLDLKTDEDCWATDMQDLPPYSSLTAFFSLTGP